MIVLVAMGLVALVAMAGFAVDVGSAYRMHRKVQAAADASAMGAAQYLPSSPDQATATATSLGTQNLSGGTVSTVFSDKYVGDDTVTVTAAGTAPTSFLKAIGVDSIHADATATARVGSYTGWANDVMPWVTDQPNVQWGQNITFKTNQAGQGNFGASQLPIQEASCSLGTGANDYRYIINATDHACLVQIGDTLASKTGNLSGPTQQGLDQRSVNGMNVANPFDPYSILKQLPDGSYVLTTYSHPNLVAIPVTDSIGNGKTSYNVLGFAWFIITSYNNSQVKGMFIGSSAPAGATCPTANNTTNSCPVGAYNQYGFKVIRLTT